MPFDHNKKSQRTSVFPSNILSLLEFIDFNAEDDDISPKDIKNACSWLLTFSPYELTVISLVISILITKWYTNEESSVIAAFLGSIASNISLITIQDQFILSSIETRTKLCEKQAKQQQVKTKEYTKEQIANLKKQISDLENQLNNQ